MALNTFQCNYLTPQSALYRVNKYDDVNIRGAIYHASHCSGIKDVVTDELMIEYRGLMFRLCGNVAHTKQHTHACQ